MQSRKFSVTTDILKRIITGSGLDKEDKITSEVIPFCTEEDIEKLSSTTVVSPADINKTLNKFPISIEAGGTGRTDGTVAKADHADTAEIADEVDWDGVKNTPNQFPAEAHFHTDEDLHSLDASKLLGTIDNKRFPAGNKGDIIISTEDENVAGFYPINTIRYVCESSEEVEKCKNSKPSMQDLFFKYSRISHSMSTSYPDIVTNPGGYPAAPSELTAWEYKKNENLIYNTTNSCSFIGLISPDKYSEYDLDVILKSSSPDDDTIGIVAAFARDASGKEHTLSFLRSCGGSGFTWACHYNSTQATAFTVYNKSDVIKWGDGSSGSIQLESGYITNNPAHGWNGNPEGTRLSISRRGNIITATTSQLGSTVLVAESKIRVDLTSDSRFNIFMKPCSVGYCAQSQAFSSWYINSFVDPSQRIYDIEKNVIWEYNATAGEWERYSTDKSIIDILIPGRYTYNPVTQKLFYIRENFIDLVSNSSKPNIVEYANQWANPRNMTISGAVVSTAAEIDGSKDITIPVTEVKGEYITGTLSNNTTGNSSTSTKLQIARKINTVAFDGTKDITIYDSTKLPLSGGKLTGPIRFDSTDTLWNGILTSPNRSIIYQNDYTGYNPVINLKTDNGRVGIGTYQSGLYFTYFKDNNITNVADNRMVFTEDQVYTTSSVAASTFNGSLSGNADTATKLKTARTINISGAVSSNTVGFDGTKNITLNVTTLDASKLTGIASVNTTGNAATATNATKATNAINATNSTYANVSKKVGINGSTSTSMQFNWSGKTDQPTWVWGGNDSNNMYVYNPSNFNVNHSKQSDYSSRSDWANGAGYADKLRINGNVVDASSIGILHATFNKYSYSNPNPFTGITIMHFDCPSFSRVDGTVLLIHSPKNEYFNEVKFNINNTGECTVNVINRNGYGYDYASVITKGIGLFVYQDNAYYITRIIAGHVYHCNCRCSDDGF